MIHLVIYAVKDGSIIILTSQPLSFPSFTIRHLHFYERQRLNYDLVHVCLGQNSYRQLSICGCYLSAFIIASVVERLDIKSRAQVTPLAKLYSSYWTLHRCLSNQQ